ncbi:hypothetical protein [Streptomyces albidoflavus]|uniref:hypothetical protein n=1 Tax=Streptomyces TaxID=1883 RepID=UPI001021DEFB|nr:hypothetical protein [Streptomyces albidoflavus]RZD54695.1 hypothetical protein C0Q59_30215 [Streptomyces albidoflavus]
MKREVSARREHDRWAERVVDDLQRSADAEHELTVALRGHLSLAEENAFRRAEALRAAALGLGPQACAGAAGISEKLLTDWRTREPAFDAAMTAAETMSRATAVPRPSGPPPAVLSFLLRKVASGTTIAKATELSGTSAHVVRRLRASNLKIDALVVAASGRRRRQRAARRQAKALGARRSYRLVQREE